MEQARCQRTDLWHTSCSPTRLLATSSLSALPPATARGILKRDRTSWRTRTPRVRPSVGAWGSGARACTHEHLNAGTPGTHPAYVRAPSSVPRARLRSSSLLARRRAIDPRGECARGPARIGSCTLCACVWSCHQCLDGERYRSGITPPPVAPDRAVSAPGAPSRGRPPTRDSAQGDTSVPPPLDHSPPPSTAVSLSASLCAVLL